MGNSHSNPSQNIQLQLQTSSASYKSGQTISGRIYLSFLPANSSSKQNEPPLPHPSQQFPYSCLSLHFQCFQSFLIQSSKQTDCNYKNSQKMTFNYENKIIESFNKNDNDFIIQNGKKYFYEFEIKLPQNLPNSFRMIEQNEKTGNNKDSIKEDKQNKQIKQIKQNKQNKYNNKDIYLKYTLSIKLSSCNRKHYPDIIKSIPIDISNHIPFSPSSISHTHTQLLSSFLCFTNGASIFTISLSKSVFNISQQSQSIIKITLQINNNKCYQDLKYIKCKLIGKYICSNQQKQYYKEIEYGDQNIRNNNIIINNNNNNNRVKKNSKKNLILEYKVNNNIIKNSTSIGNYSGIVYRLRIIYKFNGIMNQQKYIDIPIHIQTDKQHQHIPSQPSIIHQQLQPHKLNISIPYKYQYQPQFILNKYIYQINKNYQIKKAEINKNLIKKNNNKSNVKNSYSGSNGNCQKGREQMKKCYQNKENKVNKYNQKQMNNKQNQNQKVQI